MTIIDSTSGLDKSVWAVMKKAVEKNSPEAINMVLSFFRKVCRLSIQSWKLDPFKLYISFPERVFNLIYEKQKESPSSFNKLYSELASLMALHLKEIIWIDIGIAAKKVVDVAEKNIINQFYYETFKAFSSLLFSMIKVREWNVFIGSISYYQELTEGPFSVGLGDKLRFQELIKNNDMGANNAAIEQIKKDWKINNQYESYKRHVLSGVKYWLYHIYYIGSIQDDQLLRAINKLREPNYFPSEDMKDILFFRSNIDNYMNWENWEDIGLDQGKGFRSRPMPFDWLTEGFVVDRLRQRNYYITSELLDEGELKEIPFLYDSIKKITGDLLEHEKKWVKVLDLEGRKDLAEKIRILLDRLAFAKRKGLSIQDVEIAAAPLSELRIAALRKDAGYGWQRQTTIRKIFDLLGNKADLTGKERQLKFVGNRSFLEKGKIAFIEGQYYSKIFGLPDIGAVTGRWENELFFQIARDEQDDTILAGSMLLLLQNCIKMLRENGTSPTLIFMEPEYLYKDNELLNSELFSKESHSDSLNRLEGIIVVGSFDGIPIIGCFGNSLKNRALVCDFTGAFKMLYKTKAGAFEQVLSVEVESISDEDAFNRFRQEPRKWKQSGDGIELNEKDAITLIKTSVILQVGTILDYEVQDKSKFVIGEIFDPLPD